MGLKVAFGSVPKDGGTFTFYRNQRKPLLERGIELICVSVGAEQAEMWNDDFADEGCVLLAPKTYSIKRQAKTVVDFCIKENIDIVIAVNSYAMLSAIPHLPQSIRLVSRCANAFDHGYKITMSGRERLMRIIALTPRLKNDLINSYGAKQEMIRLIPNGIDSKTFEYAADQSRGENKTLQIGFVGRLEHKQKGVLHIPPIVRALNKLNVDFKLEIVGKGKHEQQMRDEMQEEIASGQVKFLGPMGPKEIPNFHAGKDIYLFTSHFEGCPNALLEAMMAACVPVSWLIDGITDFIIKTGEYGYISKTGEYDELAEQIQILYKDRIRLKDMSKLTRAVALERFTTEVCANAYEKELKAVMTEDPPLVQRKKWNSFKPDPNFDKGKLPWVPKSVRVKVKKLLSRN